MFHLVLWRVRQNSSSDCILEQTTCLSSSSLSSSCCGTIKGSSYLIWVHHCDSTSAPPVLNRKSNALLIRNPGDISVKQAAFPFCCSEQSISTGRHHFHYFNKLRCDRCRGVRLGYLYLRACFQPNLVVCVNVLFPFLYRGELAKRDKCEVQWERFYVQVGGTTETFFISSHQFVRNFLWKTNVKIHIYCWLKAIITQICSIYVTNHECFHETEIKLENLLSLFCFCSLLKDFI